MSVARRFSHLICIAAAVQASCAIAQTTVRVLHADLALIVQCNGDRSLDSEIEGFLNSASFKVLNLAQIQREHGVNLFDLRILGLDSSRRMIEFLSLPIATARYAVRLNTAPPTNRSTQLERALETFITNELGCTVAQKTRSENDASAADLFDSEVVRVEGLFQQADALKGKHKL
jgi:hypothetical protein